jgi:hypothetical protein
MMMRWFVLIFLLFNFVLLECAPVHSYSSKRILSPSLNQEEEGEEREDTKDESNVIQYFLFIQQWGGNFKR